MEEIARTFRKPEYQPVNYLTHHFWSLSRRLPRDTSLPEPPVPHSPTLVLVPGASLPPHPGCTCAQQAGPTESCLSPAGCLGLEIKRLGAAEPWPPTHEAARRLGGPPCAESEQVRIWGPSTSGRVFLGGYQERPSPPEGLLLPSAQLGPQPPPLSSGGPRTLPPPLLTLQSVSGPSAEVPHCPWARQSAGPFQTWLVV